MLDTKEDKKEKKPRTEWVIDPNKTITFRQMLSGAFLGLGGYLLGDGEGVLGFGCIIFAGVLLALKQA